MKSKNAEQYLDIFADKPLVTEKILGDNSGSKLLNDDEITDMMLETQLIKESAPTAGYDYVSSDVIDIFIAALTSKSASGGFRYQHGELSAALFTATLMLGLRSQEWQ